jgi:hypothetical protein
MQCIALPKKTLELAEKAEATLIVQVKNNQQTLCEQIEHKCEKLSYDILTGVFTSNQVLESS